MSKDVIEAGAFTTSEYSIQVGKRQQPDIEAVGIIGAFPVNTSVAIKLIKPLCITSQREKQQPSHFIFG